MIAVELIAIPKCRQSSDGIEILDAVNSRDYFVVIAAHKRSTQFPNARGDFVRAGAIADDIAQVDDKISCRRNRQARLQCFQIAMDVTQKKYAQ